MPVGLIPPEEVRRLPAPAALRVPHDFYWVLWSPTPLAGMRYPPDDLNWSDLFDSGCRALVRLEPSAQAPDPLRLVFDKKLEDLAHGEPPGNPEREERLVREAAGKVIDHLGRGEGVVVHCLGGTGRSGLVIGCALVSLGHEAGAVASYLAQLMRLRGSWRTWPEAPWQREVLNRFRASP